MYRLNDYGQLRSILQGDNHLNRRQDVYPTYQLNGALYLMRREWLMTNKKFIDDDTIAYLMPPERSADIDTQLDWDWTEFLIGKRNG
jgi:N-acylneuraminate cytidylyltransferase